MRSKTVCWLIEAVRLILFISYYGKDSVKADEVDTLMNAAVDEHKRNKEQVENIEAAEGSEAKRIIEGKAENITEADAVIMKVKLRLILFDLYRSSIDSFKNLPGTSQENIFDFIDKERKMIDQAESEIKVLFGAKL